MATVTARLAYPPGTLDAMGKSDDIAGALPFPISVLGAEDSFSPLSLFASSEEGVWYDPSDFSTIFQDNTGKTPVTAVGQVVGLLLDKSQGLALGSELISNNDFASDLTGWTNQFTGTSTWVSGRLRTTSSGTNAGECSQPFTTVVGRTYKVSCKVNAGTTGGRVSISNISYGAGVTVGTGYIITTFDGSFYFTATATTSYVVCGNQSGVASLYAEFDDIYIKEISGNHAYQATAANKPILRQDGSGFYYLEFDGSDDWLQTAAIDFSATDKMSQFAGITKDSDAAQGTIVELSTDSGVNNGTFTLFHSVGAAGNYYYRNKGTTAQNQTITPYAAPITNVVALIGDISTPESTIRTNGAIAATTAASIGTGNYGNYALYIGRRAGTTLPFDGSLYSLIVRGALTSGDDLTNAETWVNGKTGAY